MATVRVRVVPNAKRNEVKKEGEGLKVYLSTPAVEGKANKALIKILAEHFRVKKSQVKIVRGTNSRDKTIKIS